MLFDLLIQSNLFTLFHMHTILLRNLHAVIVTGMSLGIRYDEISRITMDSFHCSEYGIRMSTFVGTKNNQTFLECDMTRCPGEEMYNAILMDILVALAV